MEFFSSFGSFRILNLKTTKSDERVHSTNPSSKIRRGFCLLEALNTESFENALRAPTFKIGDRSLKISKFENGHALQHYSSQEDSRRVILKKVPSHLKEEELTEPLEWYFGRIARIFRYLAPASSSKSQRRTPRFVTYSVEFGSNESAAKAASIGSLSFLGLPNSIIVQGFNRTKDVSSKANSPTSDQQTKNQYNCSNSTNPSTLMQGEKNFERTNCIVNKWDFKTTLPQGRDSVDYFSVGKAFRFLHSMKPSSTAYFTFRDDFAYKYPSTASFFLDQSTQYRLNARGKPLYSLL